MAVEFRDSAGYATPAATTSPINIGPIDVEVGDVVILDVLGSVDGGSATFNGEAMTLIATVAAAGAYAPTMRLFRFVYEATSAGSFSATYTQNALAWLAAAVRSYSGAGVLERPQSSRDSFGAASHTLWQDHPDSLLIHAFAFRPSDVGDAPTTLSGATERDSAATWPYVWVTATDSDTDTTVAVAEAAYEWMSLANELYPAGVIPEIPSATGAAAISVGFSIRSSGNGAARNTVAVYEVAGTAALELQDPPPPAVYIWSQATLDPTLEKFDYHQVVYPAALAAMGISVAQGVARLSNYIASTSNDFILIGTSQGAAVVHDVYKKLLPGGELEEHHHRLLGVVTFGSLRRTEGHTFPGALDPSGRGVDAGRLVEDPPDYWWDFCRPGDPVCAMPDTYEGAYYTGTLDGWQAPRVWSPRHEGWGDPPSPDAGIAILLAFANNHSYFGTWQPLLHQGDTRSEIQIAKDYIYSLIEPPAPLDPDSIARIMHRRNGVWHEVTK